MSIADASVAVVKGMPVFDSSFLPPAELQFVVMTDTHYMLDPGTQRIEFESRRRQSARADHALAQVAAIDAAFVVHLGDLIQEFPESHGFAESLEQALAMFARHGVTPRQVAGNHDVGDKPDPTMPTDWVTDESLRQYHERFGRSWYSWDAAGCHFVVLNSQIMNGPLPEVAEQERWLEADLATSAGKPIFLFMHLSPFLVDEHEQGLGHYDNIDEPARGWLLDLVRRHGVQMIFSGHSHFSFFNRIGATRSRVVPSTAFTRPGFCEVFSSPPPPERGRDDTGKLGFLVVRVVDGRARVHLVRTRGETPAGGAGETRILTRTTPDLPDSPLGVTLRHPLAPATEVPIAWQSTVRQPVRNDYPLLACVEAGVRHARFPAADLANPAQRCRLSALRDEGVGLTPAWIWSARSTLVADATAHAGMLDGVEVQLPGETLPDDACLAAIARCTAATGLPVTLAPLLPRVTVPGKQHHRTRIGFHLDELPALDLRLAERGLRIDRVLCRVDPGQDPWQAIGEAREMAYSQIGAIDWAVEFADTEHLSQVPRAVAALAAVATAPGSRLYLEPLVDLDRTMDAPFGLLDRLSNPRPVFHALRTLNTLLFAAGEHWTAGTAPAVTGAATVALLSPSRELTIVLPDGETGGSGTVPDAGTSAPVRSIDLVAGTIRPLDRNADDPLRVTGATALLAERAVSMAGPSARPGGAASA